jgi:hypothetical protein
MARFEINIDSELLSRAKKFAEADGTSIEALITGYLQGLGGRRRTVREQIYRDYEPPAEVVAQLEAEWTKSLEKS